METPDISTLSLFLCALLLILPFLVSLILKLGLIRSTGIALVRMALQLLIIGIFLEYLFKYNNPFINVAWLLVMICVATFNITNKIRIKFRIFFIPTFFSFCIATVAVLLYFTVFVIRLDNIVDARFFIVIGGMLLGNSLRGDIIGINNFYKLIERDKQRYRYRLSLGATVMEAILPYLKDSLISALQPTIATMATMGIVFLPGMMTGQILGGISPILAIKYQIAIMIAIFVSTTIAINLTILLTARTCFNNYGLLKKEIFNTEKS